MFPSVMKKEKIIFQSELLQHSLHQNRHSILIIVKRKSSWRKMIRRVTPRSQAKISQKFSRKSQLARKSDLNSCNIFQKFSSHREPTTKVPTFSVVSLTSIKNKHMQNIYAPKLRAIFQSLKTADVCYNPR